MMRMTAMIQRVAERGERVPESEGPARVLSDLPDRWRDAGERTQLIELVWMAKREPDMMGRIAHLLEGGRKPQRRTAA